MGQKLLLRALLIFLVAFVLVPAALADGPVHTEVADTLTCPGCDSTSSGWLYIGDVDMPYDVAATVAEEGGYGDPQAARSVLKCPGCDSTHSAGAVMDASGMWLTTPGVTVIPMSVDGLQNDIAVMQAERGSIYDQAAVDAYNAAVPSYRQQGMFNEGGVSYADFYTQNYVADTAPPPGETNVPGW